MSGNSMSSATASSAAARREAVNEARQGLRLYHESIECAISEIRHQKRRFSTTVQNEDRLLDNLDAINNLILALNTGHSLEEPWGQDPQAHVPKLHGMAVQRYKTFAQRILDVQAEAQELIEQHTGRRIQHDVRLRDNRDEVLWRSILEGQWEESRRDINYLNRWLESWAGTDQIDPEEVRKEFAHLQARLEDIYHDWEENLGRIPDNRHGLLKHLRAMKRQWHEDEIAREEQSRDRSPSIEQRTEAERVPERREERGGRMDKLNRGLEKARDKISAGKRKAWAVFDRGIDILAEVL